MAIRTGLLVNDAYPREKKDFLFMPYMKLPWRCIINIYVLQPYCVRDLTSTPSAIVLIKCNNSISVANLFAQKGNLGLLKRLRIRSQNSTLEEHPIRGFSDGFGDSGNSVNTLRHESM